MSFSTGYKTYATASKSFTMGDNTYAEGVGAFAQGYGGHAKGDWSVVLGESCETREIAPIIDLEINAFMDDAVTEI